MDEILELLENNSKLSAEDISKIIKKPLKYVKKKIKEYEKEGIILKYKTVINKELIKEDKIVEALIEVKVTPEKNLGFDHIAERIYKFKEVKACYLVSGTYDLLLIVEGKDLHTIADFVAEKLAPLKEVKGTVTHFLLKRYKEDGIVLTKKEEDKRLAITY